MEINYDIGKLCCISDLVSLLNWKLKNQYKLALNDIVFLLTI